MSTFNYFMLAEIRSGLLFNKSITELIDKRLTKAPLQPIITGRGRERVQIDVIDMRHEPSGHFKWILYIKDYFSKYTQLYTSSERGERV